ncbi:hypothetical protein PIB30_092690 [Stylosanthes scabra]|uniref:Leucine-rich repeat-containing N-terminal plant-type domain-containing protein n=1 Tax=Stylosanthes scabra TaxID=79078 RepID=A0ABU6WT97_9FABA|nr:hypothetical protein [Stylosanthes scabra]
MTTTVVVLCLLLLLFITLTSQSHASQTCIEEDKRVLLQIKKEANNPPFLSSWTPHTDCCDNSWNGVSCGYKTNRVIYISLAGNLADRHAFKIPPSIGNLTRLERLFLFAFPKLSGPIPESISKLRNLEFLTISDTGVSGPIPSFLGKLKKLVDLDLSFNKLSGTLPPSLSQLHLLTRIDVDDNMLTCSIPDSYGSLNNLFTLALSQNLLSGRIPESLGKLNNLYYVGLSQNRLEGDASMLFGSNMLVTMHNTQEGGELSVQTTIENFRGR